MHDRLVAVGEVDGDIADGEDLMIAELDCCDPVHLGLALDLRRGLVRMNRGRMAAVDHVVSVQADFDDVGAAAAQHQFIAVVDADRIVSAANDRVVAVAAKDRIVPGAGDEQVVAMVDLEEIGALSAHQRVRRLRTESE